MSVQNSITQIFVQLLKHSINFLGLSQIKLL